MKKCRQIHITRVFKIELTKFETLTELECFGSSLISPNRISECFLDTTNSRDSKATSRNKSLDTKQQNSILFSVKAEDELWPCLGGKTTTAQQFHLKQQCCIANGFFSKC